MFLSRIDRYNIQITNHNIGCHDLYRQLKVLLLSFLVHTENYILLTFVQYDALLLYSLYSAGIVTHIKYVGIAIYL